MSVRAEAEEYHSKDFEWETLEQEIENNPSLHYHFLPFPSSQQQQQQKTLNDSDAWRKFHNRHSAGRFFKV